MRIWRNSAIAAAVAVSTLVGVATAQEAARDQRPQRREQAAPSAAASAPDASSRPASKVARLPADKETRHRLALSDRVLDVVATAGSIALSDPAGVAQMEIAYVAYRLDGEADRRRPIVFALNGGPGSSSAWLQLGGLGPWRIEMTGGAISPSAPPLLLPNDETWLDFADLVFIDPVGTGFSRLLEDNEQNRRHVYSVDGDIEVLSTFIRRYVEAQGRAASPKYIVGESYAGLRAPRMARRLAGSEGLGVNGLILVSPALDLRASRIVASAISDAARLPTMTAVAQETKGGFDPARIAAAEEYAQGDYVLDLMKGARDADAQARIARRVADFTGLDEAFVRERGGRVSVGAFRRAVARPQSKVASAYDGSISAADPYPTSDFTNFADAFSDALAPALTQSMLELLTARLGWKPEGRYHLSNGEVNRSWGWGRGRSGPEAVSALSEALAADPRLRVLVAQGYSDLVTPYFESKLLLQLLPDYGDRVGLAVYRGGHMFYARPQSRRLFHDAARRIFN